MFHIIENVLTPEMIEKVNLLLSTEAIYKDGKSTAGKGTKEIKHNLQADPTTCKKAISIVIGAILSNQEFLKCSYSKIINIPTFAKYEKNMYYGVHIDDPIMLMKPSILRCDIAMTLFLNDPNEYEGGELCVNIGEPNGTQYKLNKGSLLLYPSDTRHCVNPVISGTRNVMVTWCQSLIQDSAKRSILYNLFKSIEDPSSDKINDSYNKLIRMWADV